MRTSRWGIVLAVLVVAVGLAVLGTSIRRRLPGRCALDGDRIEPLYRVRVVDEAGVSQEFCCIRCAQLWLKSRRGQPVVIYVTDEASGQEIDGQGAFYVRSSVVTKATTGNRIHAFGDQEEAERHAAAARGRILNGQDRPFAHE
jgi:hypothetical protein